MRSAASLHSASLTSNQLLAVARIISYSNFEAPTFAIATCVVLAWTTSSDRSISMSMCV